MKYKISKLLYFEKNINEFPKEFTYYNQLIKEK